MWSFIIKKIIAFAGIEIPPKVLLAIFFVLALAGAVWWIWSSGYGECKEDVRSVSLAAENEDLKTKLAASEKYASEVLKAQTKNKDFINRQRKALRDAKEEDGPIAPVLRGTFERLQRDRERDGD